MSNKDVFSTFDKEVKKRHEEMVNDISSINIDNLKTEGVRIVIGGKTFEFTDLKVTENEDLEEKIRTEFRKKINNQQKIIREKINAKINQLLILHQTKQQEFDRKEEELIKKYSDASLMPNLDKRHFIKGLSVVKGSRNDELIWLYKALYNPKTIILYNDHSEKKRKRIPTRLINRLKKDIIISIKTRKNEVYSINTDYINNNNDMRTFSHYHQTGGGDCWGSWKYKRKYKSPDDILKLAMEAEAILGTINKGSLATRNPDGLPRIETITKSVENSDEIDLEYKSNNEIDEINEDIWTS